MKKENNSEKKPLFSLITIVYNGEKFIEEAIQKIRNLKSFGSEFEYIIIDGLSADRTYEIIEQNEDIVNFFISEKDNGISDAFNKGISNASGELIGIINVDDNYNNNTLEIIEKFYINNEKQEGIYFGNIRYFNETLSYELVPEIKNIWKFMSIYHPACFVSKSVYQKIGGYSETFKYAMDSEFIHRAIYNKINFFYVNETLANFRLEGISDKQFKKSLEEFYISVKKYNPNKKVKLYYYFSLFKKNIRNSLLGNFINKRRKYFRPFLAGKLKT